MRLNEGISLVQAIVNWSIVLPVIHVKKASSIKVVYSHILTHESDPALKYRFTCGSCQKGFITKGNLRTHVMTNICERKLTKENSSRSHMLTHESDLELKYCFTFDLCKKNWLVRKLWDHMCYAMKLIPTRSVLCQRKFTQQRTWKLPVILTHKTNPNWKLCRMQTSPQ